MSNIQPIADIRVKSKVIQNCWDYVHNNFHKFNEAHKIKVVLAIISKDMPNIVEGMNLSQVVMMSDIKKDDKAIRYNIGDNKDELQEHSVRDSQREATGLEAKE